jgi:hypothetical protein
MRLVVLVLAALVAAGCFGGDGNDDGGAAEGLRAFLVAVSDRDRPAAAEHVSGTTKLSEAEERVPRGVDIPPADHFVVLREGDVTVVATDLESEFGAFAARVRPEQGTWKVVFPSKKLRLAEGPPVPRGGVGPDQRVGFAVYSRARDLTATLWINGQKQELAGAGGPEFTRYWATPELPGGAHLAVALARAEGEVAAVAWPFTVGLPG